MMPQEIERIGKWNEPIADLCQTEIPQTLCFSLNSEPGHLRLHRCSSQLLELCWPFLWLSFAHLTRECGLWESFAYFFNEVFEWTRSCCDVLHSAVSASHFPHCVVCLSQKTQQFFKGIWEWRSTGCNCFQGRAAECQASIKHRSTTWHFAGQGCKSEIDHQHHGGLSLNVFFERLDGHIECIIGNVWKG